MAAVQATDDAKRAAAHAKNDLESYIIAWRSAVQVCILGLETPEGACQHCWSGRLCLGLLALMASCADAAMHKSPRYELPPEVVPQHLDVLPTAG